MTAQAGIGTQDIQTKYDEFQKTCKTFLPKIDRKLIEDWEMLHSLPLHHPRMKIREGKLDGFKGQAAVCISQVKEKDPGTL